MQTKCCGVMLAWCNAKLRLRAHVCLCTYSCPACLPTHTHTPLSICLSSLAAGTASCVIESWRGWMDGRTRGTTLQIARDGSPAKREAMIDSFLVLDWCWASRRHSPFNHRQPMVGATTEQLYYMWHKFKKLLPTGSPVHIAPISKVAKLPFYIKLAALTHKPHES